jgi:RimJ/RimL family protein N-acetyltransferase
VSAPPKTVLAAGPEEAERIRAAVRDPDLAALGEGRAVAVEADAGALAAFLADPDVSDPIYDLPRPITVDNVRAWIQASGSERGRGEGLLTIARDAAGEVISYSKFTVWPEHSSAELAGAVRTSRHGGGRGGQGALHAFGWMFESLGVRLIGLTAALDNVRSARLIDAAGFVRMGERESVRADGTIRRSLYWEMTKEAWNERWG